MIPIAPEVEARLREKAQRVGLDVNVVADALLAFALERDARAQAEEVAAIQKGIEAVDAGRVRPFAEFAAEMRARYGLPTHLSDEALAARRNSVRLLRTFGG